jgi:hypothetical protein
VVVNTIFCGDFEEGQRTNWKDGADITGGSYMSIEQNKKTVYIATPYDDRISSLNEKLNDTYVYYGSMGESKKEMQATQDSNAGSYGQSNKVERAISKSTHAYRNSSWDLVDAAKENDKIIEEAREAELPKEMKGMTSVQRKAYVQQKADERKRIQEEIQGLNKKRHEYIATNTKEQGTDTMLDAAMIRAIKEKAKQMNLSF